MYVTEKKELHDEKGIIFNIQRFSIHDGPGIRTTIFFKGCPLSCLWCSNPEGIKPTPQIIVRQNKCIGCGECGKVCKQGAIQATSGNGTERVQVNWGRCDQCLECTKVCPTGAISSVGKEVTVEETIVSASADRAFFQNSGGGVTASGGEPLYQWRFVKEVFRRLRAKGIHTTLDTCGYVAWEVLEEVLPYTDLVLYDLKHMDRKVHRKLTGKDNSLILSNAMKTAGKVETWFRVPLVPGCNDSAESIQEIAKFAVSLKVQRVSLLIHHEFGKHKYEQIGEHYSLKVVKPTEDEWIKNVRQVIERYNLTVTVNN